MDAIERGEIDTQFEKIIQAYTKEHRSILKSPGLVDKELPHSDTFYFDLFMSAFALVSQRKSPKEYQSHRSSLFSNQSKFLMRQRHLTSIRAAAVDASQRWSVQAV